MIYGSVCSGIEAATVAWHGLGWRPAWFSEIDPFASRVLAHRYPSTPNLGDMATIGAHRGPVDLLVGGTPCQSFSVAGLRRGLADPRGNLMLVFGRLVRDLSPDWLVWENVPGVLSADGGRAFGSLLGLLAELGYGWAWRVLDAQYFGVAQRRRRVFVVGHARGRWQRAAAVLLEPQSVRGDPPPRRAEGKEVASTLGAGAARVSHESTLMPFDPTQITSRYNRSSARPGTPAPTLAKSARPPHVAFHLTQDPIAGSAAPCLTAGSSKGCSTVGVTDGWMVRRLTPRECERLQGFPDDYTAIPGAKDGPRYRALGNSMAVPVMRWIGERIAAASAGEGSDG